MFDQLVIFSHRYVFNLHLIVITDVAEVTCKCHLFPLAASVLKALCLSCGAFNSVSAFGRVTFQYCVSVLAS